jgi:hypothetical protein
VTQNLLTLPKLTSLTIIDDCFQTTCLFAIQPGQSGLQAHPPLFTMFLDLPSFFAVPSGAALPDRSKK